MMENTGISKKEYLKKYLSEGDKKKKKKKKKSMQSSLIKSTIVDDDIDLKSMKPVNDDELEIFDLAEEAPQIAGIIDDRPEEVKVMSEYRTKKWKIVADINGIEDVKVTAIDCKKSDEELPEEEYLKIGKGAKGCENLPFKEKSDNVVTGKRTDCDVSPFRRNMTEDELKSVVKVEKDVSSSKKKREENDSDASPPRKNMRKSRGSDSDASPPRRGKHRSNDSDTSPPRRGKHRSNDSDASPPRRRKRRGSDSDTSPPRRVRRDQLDLSSSTRKNDSSNKIQSRDSDRGRNGCNSERRKKLESSDVKKETSEQRTKSDYGLKLTQNHKRDSTKEKKNSQLEKMLSGKKAGLQHAEDMKKEIAKLKQDEKEIFEKMSDELTGRHAEAIVRNRKTGRRRDAKEEARLKREKEEKEAEKIAQYAVWGKGVKQVQERRDKLEEELYEMSKPLARYKDDKDLDEMLRNQERDGDPMLEYIRRKKKEENQPSRPEYQGLYLPNRYNIKPGHKWDGVDRSNGYEKKWFEEQNARKAREEEAFKWSTEDM